jgi:hypothetical protein
MYSTQNQPSHFTLVDELQRDKNYNSSFARCRDILKEIEKITKSRVLTYFSVFKPSAGIIDSDATIFEDLLRCKNDYKSLLLILNSPGGQAVAAEKILLVCEAYAKTSEAEFYTLVPKSAKSAATIIALGADKILMSKTAELGAIDPQLVVSSLLEKGKQVVEETTEKKRVVKEEKIFENMTNVIPAFRILKSVEGLLKESKRLWNFNRGAYNQFLSQYGYDIYSMAKNEFKLSEDILQKIIQRKKERAEIVEGFANSCRIFFDPELTLSHNRPITLAELKNSLLYKSGFIQDYIGFYENQKLPAEDIKKLDTLIWEYYVRTNAHLEDDGNPVSKTIETSTHRFHLTASGQHFLT